MGISVAWASDLAWVARSAAVTQGLPVAKARLTVRLWERLLRAEHSPIRAALLWVELTDLPYFVSVHLVRHHVGVSHFVRSQRATAMQPVGYDRGAARQDAPVTHAMLINAQAVLAISRVRLCGQADPVTRTAWASVRDALAAGDEYMAALARFMVPDCVYRGGECQQPVSCGRYDAGPR